MKKRPNIVILNPDEMRADSLRHFGNQAAKTPFLDQLIKREAISFRNAFCQNPVCVPSRCSMFTGLYPHVNGHRTMSYLLREGESSIFKELKESGYYVWMNSRNDLIAGQIPGLIESHASEIYYGGKSVNSPGPISNNGHNYSMYGGELGVDENSENYSPDEEDTDAAIDFIKNRKTEDPFCLFLGWLYPHPPYQIEEPYFSSIDREKVEERIDWKKSKHKPIIEGMIRDNQNLYSLSTEEWIEIKASYLGMCMKVDYMFGKVCEALKDSGCYDDTVIFFLSDHGDFVGDYGLVEKTQNTFEDCLTKVPFIIKPPISDKTDPGISNSLIELIDLYPTIMEYAGIKPNHSHFGISLRNIVTNRETINREFVCCEGGRLSHEIHCDEFHINGQNGTSKYSPYWARQIAQTDSIAHTKGTMIRTEKFKYVLRAEGLDEFYNLIQDPEELFNEINNISYEKEIVNMKIKLMRWFQKTADIVPYDYDQRFSFEMIWAKVKNLVPENNVEEIQEKIRNGMNLFLVKQYCIDKFKNSNLE